MLLYLTVFGNLLFAGAALFYYSQLSIQKEKNRDMDQLLDEMLRQNSRLIQGGKQENLKIKKFLARYRPGQHLD